MTVLGRLFRSWLELRPRGTIIGLKANRGRAKRVRYGRVAAGD